MRRTMRMKYAKQNKMLFWFTRASLAYVKVNTTAMEMKLASLAEFVSFFFDESCYWRQFHCWRLKLFSIFSNIFIFFLSWLRFVFTFASAFSGMNLFATVNHLHIYSLFRFLSETNEALQYFRYNFPNDGKTLTKIFHDYSILLSSSQNDKNKSFERLTIARTKIHLTDGNRMWTQVHKIDSEFISVPHLFGSLVE